MSCEMSEAYARLFPMDNENKKQLCEMCGFGMADTGEGAFDLECQCASQQSPEFYVYEAGIEQIWADPTKNNFYVMRNGEMRYHLYKDEEQDDYEVIKYTSDFFELGIKTDKDLEELLDTNKLESLNNPWFEIFNDQDEFWEYGDVFFELDTAIATAIQLGKEKGFTV